MKCNLLIFFLAAILQGVSAQTSSLALVEEGRTWNTVALHPASAPTPGTEDGYYKDSSGRWYYGTPHKYVLSGDTVMLGRRYKKLMEGDSFQFALRQEGQRVYVCHGGGAAEGVLFDFGLEAKDVIALPDADGIKMQVAKVDTVEVNGIQRRRLHMSDAGSENQVIMDEWIEGIGCIVGLFPLWWCTTSAQSLMLSCCQDADVLFTSEHFLPVGEFLPAGIAGTRTDKTSSRNGVFDLQGRRLGSVPLRHGIYVEDGRKIVK